MLTDGVSFALDERRFGGTCLYPLLYTMTASELRKGLPKQCGSLRYDPSTWRQRQAFGTPPATSLKVAL